jgi:tetratricopeptide (TPR) repeat protein
MLATLLVHPGRAVPIDMLVAWVWPEDGVIPQHPASTFHTYATRIRASLRRLAKPPKLHVENGCYRLDVDRSSIDYGQFRTLVAEARRHARAQAHRSAAEVSDRALRLWRGRALDDLRSEPARAWRTLVLRDEWLPANVIHIEALLDLDEFADALARLDDLKADFENDVALARLRLSALYGLSRHAEATAYYLGVRRALLDEADEQGAGSLREHHESLRARSAAVEAPRLRESTVVPRQLPHDTPEFVGRDDLLTALDAAAQDNGPDNVNRVVVLDGMAGVGKTALVVHWGHRARKRFPDGDLFIDLQGFSDNVSITQSTVVDEFLLALGHSLSSDMPARSKELTLKRLLANRRTLVVLDNARNTAHVKGLVALLANCSIIVTSRQQLTALRAATGARWVHVEPMTAAEADDLLSARLSGQHDVDHENRTRLARICGGLPLVITVLAQHIASRPATHLDAFARQLDRRQLLTDIGEDGDGSVTAESLFLWSYQALGAAEQRLFRLLSVNPGPDIGEAAACACDDRAMAEVKRSLRILVAAHLLSQPDEFDRYRFHDLIREFARRRAEQDETAATRTAAERRLLEHYLSVGTQAHQLLYPASLVADEAQPKDPSQANPFADGERAKMWFDRERLNLVAAINFAGNAGHHEYAWLLTDVVATFLDRHGYYHDSRTVRELSVTSARAAGHRVGEASTLVGLGMVQMILGEHNAAEKNLKAALRLVRADRNKRGESVTLHHLGRLAATRGDQAKAVDLYQQCLKIAKSADDFQGLCWTNCRIAEPLRILNRHDEALDHLRESQVYAKHIGDDSAQATIMVEIGLIHGERSEHMKARDNCELALQIVGAMPIPDRAIKASACIALAEIHNEQGNAEVATRCVLDALEVADATHDTTIEAHAQEVYGDILSAAGEPEPAVQAWQAAIVGYQHIGNVGRVPAIQQKIRDTSIDGTNNGT